MILPTIHRNGTSKADLFDGYMTALAAMQAAIDAVIQTAPNGRDYYPQGDDALRQAMAEHRDRLRRLGTVADELNALAAHAI
jgi:hypothetical protein